MMPQRLMDDDHSTLYVCAVFHSTPLPHHPPSAGSRRGVAAAQQLLRGSAGRLCCALAGMPSSLPWWGHHLRSFGWLLGARREAALLLRLRGRRCERYAAALGFCTTTLGALAATPRSLARSVGGSSLQSEAWLQSAGKKAALAISRVES